MANHELLRRQKVSGGVQHIAGVCGVVVRIAASVVGLHEREPVDEHALVDLEVIAHVEARHDLEAERDERPMVGESLERDDVEAPQLLRVQYVRYLHGQILHIALTGRYCRKVFYLFE